MANHIITLNQVIKLFNDFVEQHPQLESFGYGQTSEIGTSVKVNYPAMWVTHEQDSNIVVMNRTVIPQMDFTALFFDKINQQPNVLNVSGEASNNGQEILSDTFQMAQDLLGEMVSYWGQYGIGVLENVSAFPIQDEMDDKVNGWGLRFSLKLKHFNCATEIGDVRIQRPMEINYLTCDTLPDCQTIIDIKQDIAAITGGTTTFDCDMLTGCTIITDIQTDINTIEGDINYISGTTSSNTSNINTNAGNISNLGGRVGDNEQDIAELKALTGGTTTFDCDDLDGCQTIINIKSDISAISGSTGGGGEFTGNTSENCIGEFHVENIYGCARLTIHSPIQQNTCNASGSFSTALGYQTQASAQYSHAQGWGTIASHTASHAQGFFTTSNGIASHAQGYYTIANGQASHAQGQNTTASGQYSHAQGYYTTANGQASHAGGWGGSTTGRVIAGGQTSFAHFTNTGGGNKGAMANYSAILGGSQHNIVGGAVNSAILGGSGNAISSTAINSVILGGSGITATEADTVYVPKLVATGIPAFADEAAAVAGGLETGAFYQTDGTGAAPLNVAGILMIKQ